jgi:hypothetical protein
VVLALPASGSGEAPAPAADRAQAISALDSLALALLGAVGRPESSEAAAAGSAGSGTLRALVCDLLAAPGALGLLSSSALRALCEPAVLLCALHEARVAAPALPAGDALCLLGALTQLLSGAAPSGSGGAQLAPLRLLSLPGMAPGFAQACIALASRAASAAAAEASAGALCALWPLGEGALAAELLRRLGPEQTSLLYCSLLEVLDLSSCTGPPPILDASGGGSAGPQKRNGGRRDGAPAMHSGRLLDALAFGSELLPALWRWLAPRAALPLDAPLQVRVLIPAARPAPEIVFLRVLQHPGVGVRTGSAARLNARPPPPPPAAGHRRLGGGQPGAGHAQHESGARAAPGALLQARNAACGMGQTAARPPASAFLPACLPPCLLARRDLQPQASARASSPIHLPCFPPSRVYSRHLAAVDDSEFHCDGGAGPVPGGLSLGQARAAAAALNTLVFRTHAPAAAPALPGGAISGTGGARSSGPGPASRTMGGGAAAGEGDDRRYDPSDWRYRSLSEHAPALHR